MKTQLKAVDISPPSTAKNIAIGIVWVLPGIFPASIRVAPNSPRALAKASTVPDAIPGKASGKATVQNIRHSETPKVLAAFKIFSSICSKAPAVVLYIRGKATTVAAITVAGQENISLIPKENKIFPIGPFLPKVTNKKKPSTVGGKTIGKVKMASKNTLNLPFLFFMNLAAAIPKKKVIIVEVIAVLEEIHKGERSKFKMYHS